ncbi:MAG: UDP-N-acetylglucosamine 2-epimerase (non-hydrolyzing) [Chloroflexota bacterium]
MSDTLKVLSVIGTRPEAIKMAPVIRALQGRADRIESVVCNTAQHREMVDQVLEVFDLQPDIDLDIMQPGQTLPGLTSRVILGMTEVLQAVRPDWALVQGDTTTVFAAGLAAFYEGVKVGHVEAGLRTYDKRNPFPEEINRLLVDSLCDRHFAPTGRNRQALLREGHTDETIVVTGNTVIDALLSVAALPEPPTMPPLDPDKRLLLVTAHRRENHGQPIRDICAALKALAGRGDLQIVYPVHLNPNVQGPVYELLSGVPGVTLIDPVDYLTLVHLMRRSHLILTDSGGIQEEAPSLGKPVLVMRLKTERAEAVEVGVVEMVGTATERIVARVTRLLEDEDAYRAMTSPVNPYGDGQAAGRIVASLLGESVEAFSADMPAER